VSGRRLRRVHHTSGQSRGYDRVFGSARDGVRQRACGHSLRVPVRKRRSLSRGTMSGGVLRTTVERYPTDLHGQRRDLRVQGKHDVQHSRAARCMRLRRRVVLRPLARAGVGDQILNGAFPTSFAARSRSILRNVARTRHVAGARAKRVPVDRSSLPTRSTPARDAIEEAAASIWQSRRSYW
jgi:hypothetical protein